MPVFGVVMARISGGSDDQAREGIEDQNLAWLREFHAELLKT
jgi:hypothetical protein